MELPIVFAFLTFFIVTVNSHPKNSEIIPKDYYKRQVLQPIPGYIPVYIKADEVPVVRTESKKPVAEVQTQKTFQPKEKELAEPVGKVTQESEKLETKTEDLRSSKPEEPKTSKPEEVKSTETEVKNSKIEEMDSKQSNMKNTNEKTVQ